MNEDVEVSDGRSEYWMLKQIFFAALWTGFELIAMSMAIDSIKPEEPQHFQPYYIGQRINFMDEFQDEKSVFHMTASGIILEYEFIGGPYKDKQFFAHIAINMVTTLAEIEHRYAIPIIDANGGSYSLETVVKSRDKGKAGALALYRWNSIAGVQ